MAYGYKEYRERNNISPNTIVYELQTIHSLIAYINSKYKKDIALHEIRPSDIEDYLDSEREKGLQDSTVNRKLITIRQWFNYLWEIGKVPLDFMPKFKYADKLVLYKKKPLTLNYAELLQKKKNFLLDRDTLLVSKLLFIFYMRGLRLRDIIRIEISDISDLGDKVAINMHKHNNISHELIFIEEEEIGILLAGMERALFRNTNYLFSSKTENSYDMFRLGSLKDYHLQINKFFDQSIKTEELRFAYVHYLYFVKKYTVEDIQDELGIHLANAADLVEESIIRMSDVDYKEISVAR